MEMSFSLLRTKEVVNVADGRKLGRVCDMVFCYPENKILGFVVPGGRWLGSKRTDFFIDIKNIVKIGDDVVLVNVGQAGAQHNKRKSCQPCRSGTVHYDGAEQDFQGRRSYDDYE
jgi:YlmC/YmxH family sporulation protein